MTQSRWRSKVLWGAVVAQILIVLQLAGVFEQLGVDFGLVNDVVAGLLQLAVLLGIINNPTDAENV